MSAVLSYPGVYITELTSPVHTITGVATSIAAFVGYTARGIDNRAVRIFSFSDFERAFGGLDLESELSYAVSQFYDNGGTEAYVVRVPKHDGVAATVTLYADITAGANRALVLSASSRGAWGNDVVCDVDYIGVADTSSFNLTLTDLGTGTQEVFTGLSADKTSADYCIKRLNDPDSGSSLVIADPKNPPVDATSRPAQTGSAGTEISAPDIDPTDTYSITIAASEPTQLQTAIDVVILNAGDPIPTSMTGWARLLERQFNTQLQAAVSGATVRCVPDEAGASLRLYADFDPSIVNGATRDTILTLGDGASTPLCATLSLPTGAGNVGHYVLGTGANAGAQDQTAGDAVEGVDGIVLPWATDLVGDPAAHSGIYALDRVDLFNVLCIPDATRASPGDPSTLDANLDPTFVYSKALAFFKSSNRRAFLLVDPPPEVSDVESAVDWKSFALNVSDPNAAAYFPRLRLPDPLDNLKLRTFAPCGVVAGLYARIDANRGVWKAPAGVEASLVGVQGLVYGLTDLENGVLNQLGLNCMRNFPVYGNVSWGARTLVGSDQEASPWKYVPVRRLALFLEESLFRALQWVVFEPNDTPLWAQIRLNVGAFMHDLFTQGAFQGTSPKDAYLVKCDDSTTTQNDIDRGVVNVLVAFAPLKPAEFVVIQIQQLAGQIQT